MIWKGEYMKESYNKKIVASKEYIIRGLYKKDII